MESLNAISNGSVFIQTIRQEDENDYQLGGEIFSNKKANKD